MCASNRSASSVQSVNRAVSVMEFLSRNGWSGVTEVAEELEIHKSTAYRLLATLRHRGLVEQDAATEKYRLGFGLVMLASSVTAELDLVRYARPVCERLSAETEETVTLTVLEGDEAVVVHQSLSTSSMMSVDWSGQHTPLHATADGKVLLAHAPEDLRRRVLRRQLESFTENTLSEPARLKEHLRAIVERGYGFTTEELEVGLNAVAAPVFSADGKVAAALTVSGPAFRLPPEDIPRMAARTLEYAAEVSRLLGHHTGPSLDGQHEDPASDSGPREPRG